MPTAAAVAAAAATAKIQAMDAVATNAVLGLSKLSSQLGAQTSVLPGLQQLPTTLGISSTVSAAVIPPPGIAIPQQIRAPVPILPGNFSYIYIIFGILYSQISGKFRKVEWAEGGRENNFELQRSFAPHTPLL